MRRSVASPHRLAPDHDFNPRWLAVLVTAVPVTAAVALGWYIRQAQPPAAADPVVRAAPLPQEPPSTP